MLCARECGELLYVEIFFEAETVSMSYIRLEILHRNEVWCLKDYKI